MTVRKKDFVDAQVIALSSPGQRLTSRYLNRIVEGVNSVLRAPRDITGGSEQINSARRFFPITGKVVYEGNVEQEDNPDNFVTLRTNTMLKLQISADMLPIQAGDEWLIGEAEDGRDSDLDAAGFVVIEDSV